MSASHLLGLQGPQQTPALDGKLLLMAKNFKWQKICATPKVYNLETHFGCLVLWTQTPLDLQGDISIRTMGVAPKPVQPHSLSFACFFSYVERKLIGALVWNFIFFSIL